MPTQLTFDAHLAGFRDAMLAFCRYAERAGLDVAVPPCPEWTVRRLIGHQGMIHRWARANLRGTTIEVAATEKAGRSSSDPVGWLRDGAIDFVSTVVAAKPDLDAGVFLHDAPPARLFWARRQHHETTMHAVDALSASLGRLPTAAETWLGTGAALDGIDELVLGFVPRAKSRLRSPEPVTVAIRPTDADHSFTVRVTPDGPPIVARVDGAADGDLVVEAPAVPLYLALWHRSTEVDSEIWPLWRDTAIT